MSCKIDTKETFDIITPESEHLDTKMADELQNICNNVQNNDKSAIVDLSRVASIEETLVLVLEKIHEDYYNHGLSFAVTNMQPAIRKLFSTNAGEQLNIVPTLAEAIDLVSMEGLERDLLGDDF